LRSKNEIAIRAFQVERLAFCRRHNASNKKGLPKAIQEQQRTNASGFCEAKMKLP